MIKVDKKGSQRADSGKIILQFILAVRGHITLLLHFTGHCLPKKVFFYLKNPDFTEVTKLLADK